MGIPVLAAIAAGVSNVITRNINSGLAQRIGLLQGTLVNYVVGLFFSLIFLMISNEFFKLSIVSFKSMPTWAYLGGLLGVIVIVLSNLITPKISAFYLTLFIFVGQLFTGVIIDYFTTGQASAGKIFGGLLVLTGLAYNLSIDRKESKD